MKCLHCLVEFHSKEDIVYICDDIDKAWAIVIHACPACQRNNLFLANYRQVLSSSAGYHFVPNDLKSIIPIRPKGSARPPCPKNVPDDIKTDYQEPV